MDDVHVHLSDHKNPKLVTGQEKTLEHGDFLGVTCKCGEINEMVSKSYCRAVSGVKGH